MPKVYFYFLIITAFSVLTIGSSVLAAEQEGVENPLLLGTEETPDDNGVPVPAPSPEDYEILGDIQLNPDGQAILSPEIIEVLQQSQQTEKSEEELHRQQWVRVAIDISIGIGAALVFLAIWWLVKLKRQEKAEKPKNKETK
ncbi:hypothetical protein ACFL0Z_01775 [Patescibacteria group bacterium]